MFKVLFLGLNFIFYLVCYTPAPGQPKPEILIREYLENLKIDNITAISKELKEKYAVTKGDNIFRRMKLTEKEEKLLKSYPITVTNKADYTNRVVLEKYKNFFNKLTKTEKVTWEKLIFRYFSYSRILPPHYADYYTAERLKKYHKKGVRKMEEYRKKDFTFYIEQKVKQMIKEKKYFDEKERDKVFQKIKNKTIQTLKDKNLYSTDSFAIIYYKGRSWEKIKDR